MPVHYISSQHLDFDTIKNIINQQTRLALSDDAIKRIEHCRSYLDKKMQQQTDAIYGINTGFGSLYNKSISNDQLEQLQANLVMSHACGCGTEVPQEIVKLMLFLKIQGLSYGNSGVQLITVQRLIDFFNNDVLPVIYTQGSLGASGDLAPLAHLSLPLLGLGQVYYKGIKQHTNLVYKALGWQAIQLKSKEGLALLNGTQFMSSYATWCLIKAEEITGLSDKIAALSLDAFDGRIEPFNHFIQQVRPHKGQIETAITFRQLLKDSEIISQKKQHVQDPYSFRCIPQVHGASKDAINHVAHVVFTEINSVTDNPTIFPDD
ncbi:MAG TPA: aromatic amino acid ammonia-lyase, partial [Bacteroidia bacterium]|nr:aromatic amino acid ammonia-lyase [Bacteroidia bacterium]